MTEIVNLNGLDIRFELHGEGIPIVYMTGGFYPLEQGRLMAHGLLTATLPTKIGGDMNLIAREMCFRFHRPVFSGDTIECVVTLIEATPGDGYLDINTEWRCTNQHGKEVMTGGGSGIIRDRLE